MSDNRETLTDRIFLFGIRQFIIVILIIAAGVYFLATGIVRGYLLNIVGGIFLLFLGLVLGLLLRAATVKRIRKKYYNMQQFVGKKAIAKSTFGSNTRGVVLLESEYWSAVTTSEIQEGDEVVVKGIEPDRVTLRVEKE